MDTVYGVADVLSRRHDHGERQQNHGRDAPVQPEYYQPKQRIKSRQSDA